MKASKEKKRKAENASESFEPETVVIEYKFKPNNFTYELKVEVDSENTTAKLLNIRRSKKDITLEKAIQVMGATRLVKYVGHTLKRNGYNPKLFTVSLPSDL